MTWTPPSLSNYNISPPPDDGSQVASNVGAWATIKTKLSDPLRVWIEAINTSLTSFLSSVEYPIGSILLHGSLTNPNSSIWLDLHNTITPGTARAISRADYADLFSVIGTTWGAGDGSTTFNLPPTGFYMFMAAPGKTINSTNMAVGQFMNQFNFQHDHPVYDSGHVHGYTRGVSTGTGVDGGSGGPLNASVPYQSFTTNFGTTGISVGGQTLGAGTLTPQSYGFGAFIRYA